MSRGLALALLLLLGREGIIDNKPAVYLAAEDPSVADCTGHLVPFDHPESETVVPCRTWYAPAPGRYLVWVQTPSRISAEQRLIAVGPPPAQAPGPKIVFPLVSAATIAVPGRTWVAGETLRVASFAGPTAFERRIPLTGSRGAMVEVPAAKAFAGVFHSDVNASAVAGPLQLAAGQRYEFPTAKDAKTGTLLVIVERISAKRESLAGIDLRQADKVLPPSLLADGGYRVYALWNGVPPGTYQLHAPDSPLAGTTVMLSAGETRVIHARV